MTKFNGVDFYDVDSLLTEEERMVRDTAREFVENSVIPIIEKRYRDGIFPMELVRPLGELGFLGANIEGYGCPSKCNVIYGVINQELERGDSGIRSFVSVQSSLVMYPIHTFGSEEMKNHWLPELASGEKIGCYGLTEPDFGSNPGGMRTKAVKSGDHYILNGTKMWITNGSIADVAVVWAQTDDGIRGFLVEKGTEGFSTRDIVNKLSLRASVTSELIFEDCPVPAENMLPDAKGLKAALQCLTQARYGIAWGAMGAAMSCYHTALNYALERKQFDEKPIASHQMVQGKLVYMLGEITKGQLLALQLGRLKNKGKATHAHVSLAKRNNVEAALKIARMARDVLGANGISDDYPVMRHMCNLESVYTYEGTHDIQTLLVGEKITGIPAYV
ncbi:MAG: acyl-CoA dehydrogenase family protein [Candidatus Glassbacteria bacterium]